MPSNGKNAIPRVCHKLEISLPKLLHPPNAKSTEISELSENDRISNGMLVDPGFGGLVTAGEAPAVAPDDAGITAPPPVGFEELVGDAMDVKVD